MAGRTRRSGVAIGVAALVLAGGSSAPSFARIALDGGLVHFEDDFDSLDPVKWNTTHMTSGKRWCSGGAPNLFSGPGEWVDLSVDPCHGVTEDVPYGYVSGFDRGVIFMTAGGLKATYPYIWAGPPTCASPFPDDGDFIFTVVMRYPRIDANGVGPVSLAWSNTDPDGTNQPPVGGIVLIAHGDQASGANLYGPEGRIVRLTPMTDYHRIDLMHVDGEYAVEVDGRNLDHIPRASWIGGARPNTIYIGNPLIVHTAPDGTWSDVEVDYVSVTVPQMFLSSSEIRPKLPGETEVYNTIQIDFENLEAGEEVEIEAIGGENSGGHIDVKHHGDRPLGGFAYTRNATSNLNPMTVPTDANGNATIYYQAPEIGQEVLFEAVSTLDEHTVGEADIEVKIAGLKRLPNSTMYRKVGGRAAHPGPTDTDPGATSDNNHWGMPATISIVEDIASKFAKANPGFLIRVNDMSLPLGGRFDIKGKWTSGSHQMEYGHPKGQAIDIGHFAWDRGAGVTDYARKKIQNAIEAVLGAGTERDEKKDPFKPGTYFNEEKDTHFHVMR